MKPGGVPARYGWGSSLTPITLPTNSLNLINLSTQGERAVGAWQPSKEEKSFKMQDLEAAQKFADLLHGQLDPDRDGVVAYMAKRHTTNRVEVFYAPPRTLPNHLRLQRTG